MSRSSLLPVILLAVMGTGCAEEELTQGYQWEVTLTGSHSTCHSDDDVPSYKETFIYDLSFEGSSTTLRIDGNTFATGALTGCNLEYTSPVVGEERAAGFVQWMLLGSTTLRQGGDGCDMPNDASGNPLDWYGLETFELVYSEDPDLEEGCTYEMTSEGVYLGGPS